MDPEKIRQSMDVIGREVREAGERMATIMARFTADLTRRLDDHDRTAGYVRESLETRLTRGR